MYWALVENEKIFLTALEILVATLLILFLNALRSWTRDRRLARIARAAGMVYFTSNRRFLARRRLRRLREKQGIGKDVMVIGSTGFRTFVHPEGDLYNVIRHARGARIMLLNPNSDGASTRAKTILDPEVTPERLRAQIRESIAFLKELRAAQRDVKLKLYSDPPFLKLAILGDYVWLQHYHAGLDVQGMPEYLFRYDQTPQSLYVIFYEYFLRRWNDPDIPEYDLDRDELVFRDGAGNEVKRMPGRTWPKPTFEPPRHQSRQCRGLSAPAFVLRTLGSGPWEPRAGGNPSTGRRRWGPSRYWRVRTSSSARIWAFSARLVARRKSRAVRASLALARKLRMVEKVSCWSLASFF